MDYKTKMDKELEGKIKAWREPFDGIAKQIVGVVTDVLDATACQQRECKYRFPPFDWGRRLLTMFG